MENTRYDYAYYDTKEQHTHNRRCIDGSVTGCGKCVGYCRFSGHEGFLTKKQRKEHDCLGKGCYYYLAKPKAEKKKPLIHNLEADILKKSAQVIADLEGIKIMKAEENTQGGWNLKYITLTNAYSISELETRISSALGQSATMQKLDYDFEVAARLILA